LVNASLLFFLFFALVLLALLLLAARSSKQPPTPSMDVFESLSQSRHCSRSSQIQQALRPEDTEYLRESGHTGLLQEIRQQRRRIALIYLGHLQEEFEMLLEISRALAVMSPELVGMQELERWKLSAAFAINCAYLRWRLRLGLQPASGFTLLSNMATEITRQLENATTRIAEATVRGAEQSALGRKNINGF
jgi:hypothetical protein